MRWIPFAALAAAACGGGDDRLPTSDPLSASPSAQAAAGPDAVILRVARAGGRVRASVYPALDSLVWTSGERLPPPTRALAFDEGAGVLVVVDSQGTPFRVNLRAGTVAAAGTARLTAPASADGSGIYGVSGGAVARLTPSESRPWTLRVGTTPRDVLPQADGTVLVVADRDSATVVWRLRPPDRAIADSVVLPLVGRTVSAAPGDRIWFATSGGLLGVSGRTLEPLPPVALERPVRAAASTPSGDRLFLVTDSAAEIQVLDRYREELTGAITLPGPARALRMDPLGRYLLARAADGDSAYVVAIGTDRLLGAVRSQWRADLPVVAPGGEILVAQGQDVVVVDGETLRERDRVDGGAADFWHVLTCNGVRPRPGDEPARGAAARPRPAAPRDSDSLAALRADTASGAAASGAVAVGGDAAPAAAPPPRADSAAPTPGAAVPPRPAAPRPPAQPAGFTVQFAAVRSEAAANEVARAVRTPGPRPRVVATQTSGTILYRVVLGPYGSEAEAERAGKQSGRDYWVYEGEP